MIKPPVAIARSFCSDSIPWMPLLLPYVSFLVRRSYTTFGRGQGGHLQVTSVDSGLHCTCTHPHPNDQGEGKETCVEQNLER